jgi:hypothetical protein
MRSPVPWAGQPHQLRPSRDHSLRRGQLDSQPNAAICIHSKAISVNNDSALYRQLQFHDRDDQSESQRRDHHYES